MNRSAEQSVETAFANIGKWNGAINALLQHDKSQALARARQLDANERSGQPNGLLSGMTISLKDNIDWIGTPTTAASPLFANNLPQRNAFIVDRLLEHGAIIVGKANLHELVFGPTSQSLHYGPVKNPWNLNHIAGGSSGGSGASVASDMCQASIGSDTAGSIRIPAAFNGVSGLRPTSGRISNSGTVGVSPPFDTLGPLARQVTDIARVFCALAHYDSQDPRSEDIPAPILRHDWGQIEGKRIGIPRNFFFDDISPAVQKTTNRAIEELDNLGAEIVSIDLPGVELGQEMLAFRIILADAYEIYRERLATEPGSFGDDLHVRFNIGKSVSGWEYAQAQRWVESWRHLLRRVFTEVDVILTPTIASAAPAASSVDFASAIRSIPQFTCAFAAAGIPSMALPCGLSDDGLPLSIQMAARWHNEFALFDVGAAFQTVTAHHLLHPSYPLSPGQALPT